MSEFLSCSISWEQMEIISPNLIYACILAISRLGLLPVIFHKYVTELWPVDDVFHHEKGCRRVIVRFFDISSYFCLPYMFVRGCPEFVIYVRWAIVYALTTMSSRAKIWPVKYCQAPDGVLRGWWIHFYIVVPIVSRNFVFGPCLVIQY